MQLVHTGHHPGISTTMFLPMIDMDPSNDSCILSTLSYVTKLALTYNVDPIITFDQPLWYKAQMIVDTQPPNSSLRRIICRLGGLHIQMSFLGTIGTIMTDSGLKVLLETVYAENVVPHLLSGKAISRAIRGHLLAESALCSLLAANIFNIEIPHNSNNRKEDNDSAVDVSSVEIEENDITDNGCNTNVDEEMSQSCDEGGLVIANDVVDINNNSPSKSPGVNGVEPDMNAENAEDDEYGDNEHENDNSSQLEEAMKVLDGLLAAEVDIESVVKSTCVEQMKFKMQKAISKMKESRTAQLWLQYIELLDILKAFIKAERTGDWNLHLQSLLEMLPFFAATGHNAYAKSSYIYLNKMLALSITHPNVHSMFMEGMHVVRRSDRYWAGLSTDLIIEQMLMRSVKTVGGLTRGRGMDETQRAQWILSRPACSEINYKMQELSGHRYETSEQHKECGETRQSRDRDDIKKMVDFLMDRNPFESTEESLRSIASGVVAGDKVNVDKGREVGMNILKDMEGKKVGDFKFSKKAQVTTMSDNASVSIGGDDVEIDPQLLFQRLVAAAQGAVPIEDLQNFFAYELCTYPPSLFESKQLLRQANKATLAQELTKQLLTDDSVPDQQQEIIY